MDQLAANRDHAARLADAMRAMPEALIEIPVRHYFAGGVYAREITIPKGATVVGKIHKTENLNIMSKGELLVTTDEGTVRLVAPHTIVSPPGTQRAAYAVEETVWTTLHAVGEERDLDKIEAHFICDSEQQYLQHIGLLPGGA